MALVIHLLTWMRLLRLEGQHTTPPYQQDPFAQFEEIASAGMSIPSLLRSSLVSLMSPLHKFLQLQRMEAMSVMRNLMVSPLTQLAINPNNSDRCHTSHSYEFTEKHYAIQCAHLWQIPSSLIRSWSLWNLWNSAPQVKFHITGMQIFQGTRFLIIGTDLHYRLMVQMLRHWGDPIRVRSQMLEMLRKSQWGKLRQMSSQSSQMRMKLLYKVCFLVKYVNEL